MKEYLEKYRCRVILMLIFVFLIHGAKLHSEIIGIDTEDLIHLQGDFYGGWHNTGRQGLIALKWLTNSLTFRPYLAGMLTLVLFGLAVSAFFLLWDRMFKAKCVDGQENKASGKFAWIAGGMLLIAHPVITEQFYFTIQSVEICIGMLLTAVALYLIWSFRDRGGMFKPAAATILLLLPFSSYQIFVVLFIFGTVAVLFLEGIAKLKTGEDISAGKLLKGIASYLAVFLSAFAVNTIITKLFFSSSDYLGGQILWGELPVLDNLRAIGGHLFRALTGYDSVHYHFSFGLLCIASLILLIRFWVRFGKQKKGVVAVLFFYFIALLSTPFLMTVICGGAPAVRSQLVLPFLTGFLAYTDIVLLKMDNEMQKAEVGNDTATKGSVELRNKYMRGIAVAGVTAICVVGIWGQTQTTMSLYYTDRMRYEQDAFLGRELIEEIKKVAGDEKMPIAVIGGIPFSGNNACVDGEVIGKSFFDYDTKVKPKYYWSTRRILGFLHTLGADYPQVDASRFGNAKIESDYMPVWPAEGSVQIRDRMLIIKLSEY